MSAASGWKGLLAGAAAGSRGGIGQVAVLAGLAHLVQNAGAFELGFEVSGLRAAVAAVSFSFLGHVPVLS